MRLSRETLSALCAQHSVPQPSDKLILRYCCGLQVNRSHMAQTIVHLKQYTLWLHAENKVLADTTIAVLSQYAARMNECYFTPARKSIRLLSITKFLRWGAEHKLLTYDTTDMPLSMDDLLNRPVFGDEQTEAAPDTYAHAAAACMLNTKERGYALLRMGGVAYSDLLTMHVSDLNLASRLRVVIADKVVSVMDFQDREDIILFLNNESKLKLTEVQPPHLQNRVLVDKAGMTGSVASGRYETLTRLLGLYASTRDPKLAEFIEIHFPGNQHSKRYKNCKDLDVSKTANATLNQVTSGSIVAMYRERLPW